MTRRGRIAGAFLCALSAAWAAAGEDTDPAWELLRRATHPATGLVARVPGAPLPEGGADARTAAWVAWAYAARGHTDEAGRVLAAIARLVATEPRPGVPAGLLPALIRVEDAEPALPWAVRDLDAAAWFVTACHRHLGHLDGTAWEGFARAAWPAMAACADLLADWSLGPNGPMLPSFQWALGRDGTAIGTEALAWAALEAATGLSERLGVPVNADWRVRAEELLARLLLRGNDPAPIPLDPWVAAWIRAGFLADAPPRVAGLNLLTLDTEDGPVPWQRARLPVVPNTPTDVREAAAQLLVEAE